ncbi:MAG: glycosyltransferase family 9 protein [Ignavibacteria bacterium]|nr:glycosyltransferase family 9 protein [Ignavibacteria bacterium]
MSDKRKFLIARIDRIGDTVLATPLPRELKKSFPGCEVSVLVRSYTKDIFLHNPFVDHILVWDDFSKGISKIRSLAKFLKPHGFTDGFMLLPNETLAYSFFLAGIKRRYGTSRKLYHLLTNTISLDRKKYAEERSEADYCLDFVRSAGGEVTDFSTKIYLSEEEQFTAEKFKKETAPNGEKITGVHITSGGSAPNMPAGEYLRLINLLSSNPEIKVVVTDNRLPHDLTLPEGIPLINEGKSLRESIINFSVLDLLISSSTGTMHIAAALGVDTLSLFCPLPACKPSLWGPVGNKAEFILPSQNYCATRCPGDPKKCDFSGEGGIDAGIIYSKTMKNLR